MLMNVSFLIKILTGETGSRGAHQRFPAYPDDYDDSMYTYIYI